MHHRLPRAASSLLLIAAAVNGSCDVVSDSNLNVFTIEEDIELGKQLRDEINNDPETYPVIYASEYPEAYDHLYRVRDALLASGEVQYADDFEWEVYLIHDDATLNAFAAPGGYMYVYTGLLRYLDREDDFAGVLGHEIAHADRRHSTQQLTKYYGVFTLVDTVLGGENSETIAELAAALVGLSFSRDDETESDEYSVIYLCDTGYASNGAAGFFEKLLNEDSVELPEFLSTHPSSESRVEDINAIAEGLGCPTEANPDAQWEEFLASLPPEQVAE